PAWTYFTKLGHVPGFKQKRRLCTLCNTQINDAIRQARTHNKSCPNMTSEQRKICSQQTKSTKSNLSKTVTKTSTNIESFGDRISKSEQLSLELSFARSIFYCGLVLLLPELDPIKDLWRKARPAFKLPNRKRLSTTLLDKVYNETKQEIELLISKTHPTGEICQNSKTIANNLKQIIVQVGIKKISAVITDNAAVMKKAWKILEKEYSKIFFLECISHNLHLLVNDIIRIPWAAEIVKKAKEIVKYFKSHNIPAAILKRHRTCAHKKSLKTFITCWGSIMACLSSLVENKSAIHLTKIELSWQSDMKIPKTICKTIEDERFWQDIKFLLKVLKQLVTGIALFESDTPRLAMFYEWYHKQLDSTENVIYEILEKRWKKIFNPVMLLAHLLDPNYHGRSLARNSTTIIESFIRKYYSKDSAIIWEQMTFYKTRSGIFDIKLAWDTVDKVDPIMCIPCSSAASERNWSAFSYIHDRKRSRLTPDRVLKLVYIYSNYKLTQPHEDSQKTTRILEYLNSVELNNYEVESARSLDESFNNTEDEINGYDMKTFLEDEIDGYDTETVESEEEDKSDKEENRSDEEESNKEKNRDSEEESNEENRDEENIYYYS
ncbi:24680_t:CDS:2, partial [Gigaspora rosea]